VLLRLALNVLLNLLKVLVVLNVLQNPHNLRLVARPKAARKEASPPKERQRTNLRESPPASPRASLRASPRAKTKARARAKTDYVLTLSQDRRVWISLQRKHDRLSIWSTFGTFLLVPCQELVAVTCSPLRSRVNNANNDGKVQLGIVLGIPICSCSTDSGRSRFH